MTSPSRTVRVFISSTFRDFGKERDLLVKGVFTDLRRRARERLVEVIGVDLRAIECGPPDPGVAVFPY